MKQPTSPFDRPATPSAIAWRDRYRLRSRLLAAAFLLVAGTVPPSLSLAQENGLEGRELLPVSDLGSEVGSLLVGLLRGEDPPQGRIFAARVEEDGPDVLRLRVHHEGLGGYRLRGRLLDEGRHQLRRVASEPVMMGAGSPAAELVFRLAARGGEGKAPVSAYLLLEVLEGRRSLSVLRRTFRLPKTWSPPTSPQDLLIEITPVAVGRARTLPRDPRPRPPVPVYRSPGGGLEAAPSPGSASPGRPSEGSSTGSSGAKADPPSGWRSSPRSPSPRPAVRDRRGETEGRRPAVRDRRGPRPAGGGSSPGPAAGAPAPGKWAAAAHADLVLGLAPADRDRGARGPSPERVDLLEGWRPDPQVQLREEDILSFPRVFRDQHEASGIYYFQPDSYQLAWDGYEGYAFRMLYQAGEGGRGAGNVLVRMTLDAGIDPNEIEVARALLESQRTRRAIGSFKGLSRIPIEEIPRVELAADLEQLFDIPADKVRASGVSDPLGRLDVALTTDSVTKENLQLALLEGGGLGGRVRLSPSGGRVGAQAIPFSIDPSARANFPRLHWQPGMEWQNRLPYPVLLRYLHVLRLRSHRPVVYSWSLGDRTVPRRARVEIDPRPVPGSALHGALQVWIDYVLVDSCRECDEEVLAAVTSGVSSVASDEIVFRTLSPLADTGAVEITLEVRSRYFHPRSRELRTHPLRILGGDGESFAVGPIYPAAQERGPGGGAAALYEYRLRLVMPDGGLYDSRRWIPADSLYQPIGRVQLEEALGPLPGSASVAGGRGLP